MEKLIWKNGENLTLAARHWPVINPKAVIALVHGHGEHCGRFHHVAEWYNNRAVAVISFDLQGHGESEGIRGHVKDYDCYLDDIGILLDQTASFYPNIPVFLYGHSLGGNLVLNYTFRRHPALQGLIATSPWVKLAFQPPMFKVFVGRILSLVIPAFTLPTNLAVHFLSRDPQVIEAYKNDPLVHGQISTAAGAAILHAAEWLQHFKGAPHLPVLLQHGTSDKITSEPATRELAKNLTGDVTYKAWPNLYHEMHNEVAEARLELFNYTFAWMEKRLP